jgi:hypothetical protein
MGNRVFRSLLGCLSIVCAALCGCDISPSDTEKYGERSVRALRSATELNRWYSEFPIVPRFSSAKAAEIVTFDYGAYGHSTISRISVSSDIGAELEKEVGRINAVDPSTLLKAASNEDVFKRFGEHCDKFWPRLSENPESQFLPELDAAARCYMGKSRYDIDPNRWMGAILLYSPKARVVYFWTWSLEGRGEENVINLECNSDQGRENGSRQFSRH